MSARLRYRPWFSRQRFGEDDRGSHIGDVVESLQDASRRGEVHLVPGALDQLTREISVYVIRTEGWRLRLPFEPTWSPLPRYSEVEREWDDLRVQARKTWWWPWPT